MHYHKDLMPLYEEREARNIAKIILHDYCHTSLTETELNPQQIELWKMAVARLLANEPLQYILGKTNFWGYDFKSDARALIPRPETEELLDWVLQDIKHGILPPKGRFLDIGTGTGCIPIVFKKKQPLWEVSAIDISADALSLAVENAQLHSTDVQYQKIDILAKNQWCQLPVVDCIVSNPPYILEVERAEMAAQVVDFEPAMALFVPDNDPLLFYRTILEFAYQYLAPKGYIYFEIHEKQLQGMQMLATSMHYTAILQQDMSGRDRMMRFSKK
jgi:release factor glutamine methyltransferase